MLVCVFLCMFAHETAGAARIRRSLRPLIWEGETEQQNSGELSREIEVAYPCHPGLEPGPIRRGPSVKGGRATPSATTGYRDYGSRPSPGRHWGQISGNAAPSHTHHAMARLWKAVWP